MNMKLISVGVAALFALAALPTANASSANDGLTRTFSATVFAELEFKDRGLGIYNAGSPQVVCPASLLGLRAVVSDAFYYQRGRVDLNVKAGIIGVTSPVGMGPGIGPCPIPGTAPDPQFVWVPDFNVKLAFSAVTADQLICGQQSFLDCFPDPATASLDISNCGLPTFENQRPDDNKGLLGGTGIAELLMSRSVISGCGNSIVYLDGPNGINTDCDFDFGEGGWGTGFCLPQTNDHVPYGSGSAYIVTCASTGYDWFDFTAIPPVSGSDTATSHDYVLILDAGTPTDWPAALTHHVDDTGQVDHLALQGWSDLGGSNGCPSTTNSTAYDADAKKKNSEVLTQTLDLLAALNAVTGCEINTGTDAFVICRHNNGDPVMCEDLTGALWVTTVEGPANSKGWIECGNIKVEDPVGTPPTSSECEVLAASVNVVSGKGTCGAFTPKGAYTGIMTCHAEPGANTPPIPNPNTRVRCFDP